MLNEFERHDLKNISLSIIRTLDLFKTFKAWNIVRERR